jgi:hypothetical protein
MSVMLLTFTLRQDTSRGEGRRVGALDQLRFESGECDAQGTSGTMRPELVDGLASSEASAIRIMSG